MVAPPSSPLLGDRYRVQHLLGPAGTAQVFQARDELLDRPVMVKLFPHPGGHGAGLGGYPQIRAVAGLRHPGLLTVLDVGINPAAGTDPVGTAPQRLFVVLAPARGVSLAQRLTGSPLPRGQVAVIGEQLALTLAYLHQRGVVHRGVHPAHVLLDSPHPDCPLAVTLTDFDTTARGHDTPPVTSLVPAPAAGYRSPEHVAGLNGLTPASDVYALALVLLTALTGRPTNPAQVVEASAVGTDDQPPTIPDDLGPGWVGLLQSMTHPDPGYRPAATVVAGTLREFADAATVASAPLSGLAAIGLRHHPKLITRRYRPWQLIPAATVLLAWLAAITSPRHRTFTASHRRLLTPTAAALVLLTGLILFTPTRSAPPLATDASPPAPVTSTPPAPPARTPPPAAPAAAMIAPAGGQDNTAAVTPPPDVPVPAPVNRPHVVAPVLVSRPANIPPVVAPVPAPVNRPHVVAPVLVSRPANIPPVVAPVLVSRPANIPPVVAPVLVSRLANIPPVVAPVLVSRLANIPPVVASVLVSRPSGRR